MLVIHNAIIPSIETDLPTRTAIAIDQGRIVSIGNGDDILASFPNSEKIDAHRLTILPGFTDAHIHLQAYALSLMKVDCETNTQSECLRRVFEKAKHTSPGEWVLGHGWNHNNWSSGYGTARQLDEIAPHNPVYLTHKSLHCGWANTRALNLAGIDSNTPDPEDGKIGHLEDGTPSGIIFESAMELVDSAIPKPSVQQLTNAIQDAQISLQKMGLTGVHDFDHADCFSALQVLHAEHKLKLRVVKSIPYENLNSAINLGLRTNFGDDILKLGSVKLFADGALGPQTAAMLKPYEGDPFNYGMLMLDEKALLDIGGMSASHGISLAVHAIGDRANHEVLNAYAQLRQLEHANRWSAEPLRHRIEHVQVIDPADFKRFPELNIIASMQPIHATSDMQMADKYWGRRSENAYAWHGQIIAGSRLIFGSDAPVESPNPFWGIHAAVTRRRIDGYPIQEGWYPEQRLSVGDAIKAYTSGPAFAAHMEKDLGKLDQGFLADLILVDKNPFTIPADELLTIHTLASMLNGNWEFSEL